MEIVHGSFSLLVLLAVVWLNCCQSAIAEVIRYPGAAGNEAIQETAPRDNGLDKARIGRLREMAERRFPNDVSARNNYVTDWVVKDMVSDDRSLDKITFIDTDNGKLPTKEEIMSFSGSADALRNTAAIMVNLPALQGVEQSKVLMEGFKEALKLYEFKRQLKTQPNSIWNDQDGWKPDEAMYLYVVRRPYDIFKVNIGELLHGGSISDFPIRDLKLRNLNRSFYPEMTLKDKMVQTAIHELQNDKDFLKQAIDVRERAKNLLDNEKLYHEKKQDDVLFPELKEFYKDNATKGGNVKADGRSEDDVLFPELKEFYKDNAVKGETEKADGRPEKDVAPQKRANDDSLIGVKGWCHCWEKTPFGQDSFEFVGWGNDENCDDGESCEGDFAYKICNRCGKCFTTRSRGDKSEADIIDLRIYRKYHKEAGRSIPTQQYVAMLREAEDKLLAIPDGHIVIPGTCKCKKPDPIKMGFVDNELFYVCGFCGRVRLPDKKGGNMPVEPSLKKRDK